MSSSKAVKPEAINPEPEVKLEATHTRKLYTPQPKQAKIIERHLNGESDRKIAREENIDRATVARILTEPELVATRARQQSYAERLGFKAMAVMEESMDSDYPNLAFAAAAKHLEGIGVYDKRGLQGTIADAKAKHMRSTEELQTCLCGPGSFGWPPPEPISQPEPKKRTQRKPSKPEGFGITPDDPSSEDDGPSST